MVDRAAGRPSGWSTGVQKCSTAPPAHRRVDETPSSVRPNGGVVETWVVEPQVVEPRVAESVNPRDTGCRDLRAETGVVEPRAAWTRVA